MHCEQAEMMLAPWAFGEIEAQSPQGLELTEHLTGCESCRDKLGDLRVAAALLSEALAARPAPALSENRRRALLDIARQTPDAPDAPDSPVPLTPTAPLRRLAAAPASTRRGLLRGPLFWRKMGIAASLGVMGLAGAGLMLNSFQGSFAPLHTIAHLNAEPEFRGAEEFHDRAASRGASPRTPIPHDRLFDAPPAHLPDASRSYELDDSGATATRRFQGRKEEVRQRMVAPRPISPLREGQAANPDGKTILSDPANLGISGGGSGGLAAESQRASRTPENPRDNGRPIAAGTAAPVIPPPPVPSDKKQQLAGKESAKPFGGKDEAPERDQAGARTREKTTTAAAPDSDRLALRKAQEDPSASDARKLDADLRASRQQPRSEAAQRLSGFAGEETPADEFEKSARLPAASLFPEIPVNPFVLAAQDRLSTFSLESESASYVLARRYLRAGYLPPRGAVRMEEFINHFDYHYPQTSSRTFGIHADAAPAPFGENLSLLRIGVQAKTLGRENRKPAHLVFVVDASGSMARADRLPLVRQALGALTGELDARDRITLIAFSDQPRLLLEHAPADPATLVQALENLQTGGATHLLEGLKWGYQQAGRHYTPGAINRVILCTDGVANVGPDDAQQILDQVSGHRRQGITLTALGFGTGQYNDRLMEDLAARGDGHYAYIDTLAEARRLFVEQFASTLQTVAFDAKIQVEFNPQRVRRYRLIGYENRDLADQDFRNDAVDAGEVGSGRSATALYELELIDDPGLSGTSPDLGTVYVRYRSEPGGEVEEISRRLENRILMKPGVGEAPHFYLAAAAAEFAEILRGSPHARTGSLAAVEDLVAQIRRHLPMDSRIAELHELVKQARGLPPAP